MKHASTIQYQPDNMTKKSPRGFCEDIYICYIQDKSTEPIDQALDSLSTLQQSIHKIQTEVLQIMGVDENWETVAATSRVIQGITSWVEEILCQVLMDESTVPDLYREQKFMYQVMTA